MKLWRRGKKIDLGETLVVWHHRAVNRFTMKIFTWLLGGFVSGMLTAILLAAFGFADIAQIAARIVFFLVFIAGAAGSFYRNVYFGLEYRLTDRALVSVRPQLGTQVIGQLFGGSERPFAHHLEYINLEEVKDLSEEEGNLLATLKQDRGSLTLGIAPVVSLKSSGSVRKAHGGAFSRDDELDKEAIRLIMQKAREAKRQSRQ